MKVSGFTGPWWGFFGLWGGSPVHQACCIAFGGCLIRLRCGEFGAGIFVLQGRGVVFSWGCWSPSTQGFPAQYCIETRLSALYMPPCQFFYFHGCLSLLIILNSCGYSRLLGAGQLYGSFYLCNKFSLFLYLIHWISQEEAFILFLNKIL